MPHYLLELKAADVLVSCNNARVNNKCGARNKKKESRAALRVHRSGGGGGGKD